MNLFIKKLNENAIMPKRATAGSAGFDLYACIDKDIVIKPNEILKIPTGIAIALPNTEFAVMIYPRSGLSSNYGISLANCVGVIDSDYRGEILIPLINHSNRNFIVTHTMRIAQMVLTPIVIPQIIETDSLTASERNTGGFGSSGL